MNLLNDYVTVKCKYLRGNDGPYMNKELRKAVMCRSRVKNRFYKEKSDLSRSAYKRQRNKCVNLFKKAKSDYYRNLKPSSVTDNKTFWKNVKPLFSDKQSATENIVLVENNHVISEDKKVAQCFGCFLIVLLKIFA